MIRLLLHRAGVLVAVLAIVTFATGCGDDGSTSSGDNGPSDELRIGGVAESGGPVAWPAPRPDEVADLTDAAGLALETKESLTHHVHAHLDVFIDGEHQTVPAGIGIVFDDPAVNEFEFDGEPAYGGIQGCDTPCISPLHTHDVSGVLHTESAVAENNTLGQFFTEWDVRLDDECVGDHCTSDTSVRVFVDGEEVPLEDAADIELTEQQEIAIVIGDPPASIPDEGDFSAA